MERIMRRKNIICKLAGLVAGLIFLVMPAAALPVYADGEASTISSVTVTSNLSTVLQYGTAIQNPKYTITTPNGLWVGNEGTNMWQKYNETTQTWVSPTGSFTEGRWRCRIDVRFNASDYVPDTNGITVTVDGTAWSEIFDDGTVNNRIEPYLNTSNTFYIARATSPEFTITAPPEAPLEFLKGISSVKIPSSEIGKSISEIDISDYVTGGKKPYTFSKESGPAWLSVSEAGVISGKPTMNGTNVDLKVKVTDSKGSSISQSIAVDETYLGLAYCETVSKVAATSNITGLLQFGAIIQNPEFTIQTGKGIKVGNQNKNMWQKYNEETQTWENQTGTFTIGKWRCRIQVYLNSSDYVLDQNGVTVTVDGTVWSEIDDYGNVANPIKPYVNDSNPAAIISYLWATSPEFTVEPISWAKGDITVDADVKAFTYNGTAQGPKIEVFYQGTKLTEGTDYDLAGPVTGIKAGAYKLEVCMKGDYKAGVACTVQYQICKAANPLVVKGKAKPVVVKYSKLRRKSQTLAIGKVLPFAKKLNDKKTYSLASAKKGTKSYKKFFKIDPKNGKVTVKKGLKRGTYKVTVRVRAAGDSCYKPVTKAVLFKIRVK